MSRELLGLSAVIPFLAPVSSGQLFCTTRRETSSELALDPYSQSKGVSAQLCTRRAVKKSCISSYRLRIKYWMRTVQQTKVSTIPRTRISVDLLEIKKA
ncbi:unnamed protein product [Larinioides sclopetarius]|uniref:Secreted protein n=1 Tax=Larinioides sclopetarius TaxID=280406 RepID=A0AAV1Z6T0_9ARAC